MIRSYIGMIDIIYNIIRAVIEVRLAKILISTVEDNLHLTVLNND